MPRLREEAYAPLPFGLGGFHLANEGVQMSHQGLTQFSHTRIGRAAHAGKHRIGDGCFVKIAHGHPLRKREAIRPTRRVQAGLESLRAPALWDSDTVY